MPTRTQQCDVQLCAYASHGDTRHIVLYPADPGECFTMAVNALDLADQFQTPVFFLSDIDIGMNDWMVDELTWDENYKPNRGKILSAEDVENLDSYHRYLDIDGDHIPYRTLPGTHPDGAYFLRGSGHNKFGNYTEKGEEYKELVDRLYNKWKSAADHVPQPVLTKSGGKAQAGIIAIGGSDRAVLEAREKLEADGIYIDYLRIRAFPFPQAVQDFLDSHQTVFVVDQNRDAQLHGLLVGELSVAKEKLVPVLHYSGEPLTHRFVYAAIEQDLKVRKSA